MWKSGGREGLASAVRLSAGRCHLRQTKGNLITAPRCEVAFTRPAHKVFVLDGSRPSPSLPARSPHAPRPSPTTTDRQTNMQAEELDTTATAEEVPQGEAAPAEAEAEAEEQAPSAAEEEAPQENDHAQGVGLSSDILS